MNHCLHAWMHDRRSRQAGRCAPRLPRRIVVTAQLSMGLACNTAFLAAAMQSQFWLYHSTGSCRPNLVHTCRASSLAATARAAAEVMSK